MIVRQNHQAVKRPRGRPPTRSDEETRHLVVEAAAREFQARGYAATCMADVAEKAGISTKTIYRLIPTKAELFATVVADRIGQFMLAVDERALAGLDLADALERILIAYGTLTLAPETISINRLVLGESERFPEIASTFHTSAIVRTTEAIAAWLRRQCERGLIRLADPDAATGMLRGMMIMEPQRAVMLGQRSAPDAAEIAARARVCTELFLKGCQVREP